MERGRQPVRVVDLASATPVQGLVVEAASYVFVQPTIQIVGPLVATRLQLKR